MGKAVANNLAKPSKETLQELAQMQDHLDKLGVTLVTAVDAGYPELVEQMDPDCPGALFLYGNTKLLASKTFTVMSSRKSRPNELNRIEALSEEGVLQGEVLVCGHDTPEYQRAAIVPLRYGSPRILCLDQGLFKALGNDLTKEAFRTARLYRYQFDAKTDLVISPFRPYSDFIGANNRTRDRLVASLARRLDFVNVSPGGNMEKLARMALKAGRPVRVCDTALEYRVYRELGATILEA